MATSIYIAGTEAQSGKSAVAVGLLDQLSRRAGRVGVFRPIVRAGVPDELVRTLLSQLPGDLTVEQACGVTYDDLHASPERAMGTIVDRFHEVARGHDVVLVVGSDFTDVSAPTEFSVNAAVAANLGSRLLLVVPAQGHDPAEVATTAEMAVVAAREAHAHVTGVVANQVDPALLEETASAVSTRVGVPVQALPETPLLRAPTVRDLMDACSGRLVHGDTAWLDRECTGLVVAAMTMPHVLDRLIEGGVVIVPGDREDVVLGVLLAHRSKTFPTLSGIVLNGGFPLTPQVERLIEGLDVVLPVIATDSGTMTTATRLGAARGRLAPDSTRKLEAAVAMVERGLDAETLLGPVAAAGEGTVTPLMFEHRLVDDARAAGSHIVLPEGAEDRILLAADTVLGRGIARLTLLGDPEVIHANAQRLGVDVSSAAVVDPGTSELREGFAADYARLRAHKGVTLDQARDRVVDPSYFGTMMVHQGLADGMVSGCITTTAHTIRPALEIVRTAPDVSVVSSVFLMCLADRVLVYGDCAVNPDPTAEQLADIAISSARTARQFGIEPRVAMLSYSTGESGSGVDVDKVRAATALVHERAPGLLVEGPIQYDAAVDLAVAATKLKDSPVAGRATVLVFPDLNTGNNTYKAVQRSASAVAIGPVMQGLNQPVNDLSRGALVRDIVNTIAITAIQAGAR
ncbi:phosphate acetyltransferase [Phycicoccus sp. Root101]|uniref:phosphate acetyltransferase n=1 Tax=Phycicoccus sp. Root101 TaxID=1736421 RepID=UPI000702E2FC|nr:phosphate acetyltransferase [Phycicoccus sp. Root101]KQU68682.1 phosphate acetyltransferase [Phycicoccus sp. Root101]